MSAVERVVHRLARDRTDVGSHGLVDVVGGAVRVIGHRSHDGQPLRGDLHAVPAEERLGVERLLQGHSSDPMTTSGVCP